MEETWTRLLDTPERLDIGEGAVTRLNTALEKDDPGVIMAALGDIARANGMRKVAQETGLGRESLYKSLCPTGNPKLDTLLRVLRSLGIRLQATTLSGDSGLRPHQSTEWAAKQE